ncbi:MAG: acyl-CoA reductase [Bacteroidales bacterium]|jgi:hypothetical protein
MYKEVFIRDFSLLGKSLDEHLNGCRDNHLLDRAFEDSLHNNPLFSENMQKEALRAVVEKFLMENILTDWLVPYENKLFEKKCIVGIIMAGNLPLVGFHDFLVAMASGCRAQIKLSGKDRFLLPLLFSILCDINSFWKDRVEFTDSLPENPDMLLATGGDESAKIFANKYKDTPKIIRSSRSSIAILQGDETEEELQKLSKDIFLYYGMGCRSVSTLLVPKDYSFGLLTDVFGRSRSTMVSEDYLSAYKYQKAVASMQNSWFLDGGFYILREFVSFPPPMGIIGILMYKDINEAEKFVNSNKLHLQCLVGKKCRFADTEVGETQYPSISDYADGLNSLEFILNNV